MKSEASAAGTGTYLKTMNPAVRLIGVQPDSPFHGESHRWGLLR